MKIDGKNYFTFNQVLKTKNLQIIDDYIKFKSVKLRDKVQIGSKEQNKLVNLVIELNSANLIIEIISKLKNISQNNLDKLTDAIAKKGTIEDIYYFSREINNLSYDNINKLVDALVCCKNYNYSSFMNRQKDKYINYKIIDEMGILNNDKSISKAKYIYLYAKNVKNLSKENIKQLTYAILRTSDIYYISEFYLNVNIYNYENIIMERYVLEKFSLPKIAEFLKKINNRYLIDAIFGDYNTLNEFIKEYEKNGTMKYEATDIFLKNRSSVRKNSCFIPTEQLIDIYKRHQEIEAFASKYKYAQDNINDILNKQFFINKKS